MRKGNRDGALTYKQLKDEIKRLRRNLTESDWIPIKAGCQMPDEGEEVQVTLWIDNTVNGVPGEVYAVDNATYSGKQYYIPDATGKSGFVTVTDWIESSGVVVVAWRKKPFPYICDQAEIKNCRKVWEAFRHA